MNLLINIVMAWLTVALMVMLLMIYALRKYIQMNKLPIDSWVRKLNRKLRKQHKWVGIAAIISAFIHGLYSSIAILSTNKGTILWLLFIALGLSFMFRKSLKQWRPWIKVHRVLAVATMAFLMLHLVEVDWFVGVEPIISAVKNDLYGQETVEQTESVLTESHGIGQGNGRGSKTDSNAMTHETSDAYDLADIPLVDGVYTGEAVGYQPGLIVEVTVKNQMIASVEVVEHNEVKEQFWGRPVKEIPVAIVEEQSTDVDVVSGATFTSIGIMHAVENALMSDVQTESTAPSEEATVVVTEAAEETNAVNSDPAALDVTVNADSVDDTVSDDNALEEEAVSSSNTDETTPVIEETADASDEETAAIVTIDEEAYAEKAGPSLMDGVYMGEGYGFNPGLFVALTIEDGEMVSVVVVDHREEKQKYWGIPVIEIPKAIIETQSTEVDVVSGATYTSLGIMEAVEDALSKAKQ